LLLVGLERLEAPGLVELLLLVRQPRLVLGDALARVQEVLPQLRDLLRERRKGRAVLLDPREQCLEIALERRDVLRDLLAPHPACIFFWTRAREQPAHGLG